MAKADMELMRLLDENEIAEDGGTEPTVPFYEEVRDGEMAASTIRKVKAAMVRRGQLQQWLDVISAEVGKLIAHEDAKIERAGIALEPWVRKQIDTVREIDPKAKKSMDLPPYGRAGFRKGQDKLVFLNEDEAVAFAEENGIEVKVKKTVNKTPFKKYLENHPVPGCVKVIPAEEKFYVDVKE